MTEEAAQTRALKPLSKQDLEILKLIREGIQLDLIGRAYSISKQRVCQIRRKLERHGHTTVPILQTPAGQENWLVNYKIKRVWGDH